MFQVVNLEELGFAPGDVRLSPVMEADKVRVLLLSLEEGQSISPCRMSLPVLYIVLQGRGQLLVKDESAALEVNSVAIVPQDVVRSIRSETRMRVLAIQIS